MVLSPVSYTRNKFTIYCFPFAPSFLSGFVWYLNCIASSFYHLVINCNLLFPFCTLISFRFCLVSELYCLQFLTQGDSGYESDHQNSHLFNLRDVQVDWNVHNYFLVLFAPSSRSDLFSLTATVSVSVSVSLCLCLSLSLALSLTLPHPRSPPSVR